MAILSTLLQDSKFVNRFDIKFVWNQFADLLDHAMSSCSFLECSNVAPANVMFPVHQPVARNIGDDDYDEMSLWMIQPASTSMHVWSLARGCIDSNIGFPALNNSKLVFFYYCTVETRNYCKSRFPNQVLQHEIIIFCHFFFVRRLPKETWNSLSTVGPPQKQYESW